jgi:hypothetical protein
MVRKPLIEIGRSYFKHNTIVTNGTMELPNWPNCYEDGKMDALIARFGDHTDAIFKRHNMKSIGFWRPEDAPYSQNMFVYILEHSSREEARKNWPRSRRTRKGEK